MPNLVGIGNSQVPTNAMLGGLAYQDSVGEIDIEKIKARTSDNAVDIFVYDTRKDSDGGAWRHRTQNKSWYNEGVSQYRGARKEFPTVAVIVVTNNSNSTAATTVIYDGDDPNLPMWMKWERDATQDPFFDFSTPGSHHLGNYEPTSVSALNGIICVGTYRSAGALSNLNAGLREFHFIEDACYASNDNRRVKFPTSIADRDVVTTQYFQVSPNRPIINSNVNDVAMTVLPNASIDVSTGLPVPTIAVATDGGVSVIKDDESVVDITVTNFGYTYVTQIKIDEKFVYMGFGASNLYVSGIGYAVPIPSADVSLGSIINATSNADFRWSNNSTSGSGGQSDYYINPSDSNDDDVKEMVLTKRGISFGTESGASILLNDQRDTNGSVAFITSSFNSGYMHGDIKGAFLSDTDDTNVTGTELLANPGPSFSNTNNWYLDASNQTSGTIATLTVSSGRLVFTHSDTNSYWDGFGASFTCTVGEVYVVRFDIHSVTSMNLLRISNSASQHDDQIQVSGSNVAGVHAHTFTATATTMYLHWNAYATAGTMQLNSVSVRIAEEDRSVNNKGLQVFGTINKNPVATDAELVSYSGFEIPGSSSLSVTNGLIQPYNSSLSGTQFVFSGWFKTSPNSDYQYTVQISDTSTEQTIGGLSIFLNSGGSAGLPYMFSSTGSSSGELATFSGYRVDDNRWHHFVAIFDNTNKTLYVDGISRGSSSISGTITTPFTGAEVYIGMHRQIKSGGDNKYRHYLRGDAALIRISKTAPTAEQVKKMYDDEKCLFHEDAKCTIFGTTSAVKGLAYDDSNDVLHVGTTSGRSEFRGLNRINNTTTAVNKSISASNGLVAEK